MLARHCLNFTGAKPNALPISGIDLPGVFSLRGARDMDKVHDYMGSKQMKKVVLIGAGMIGMELAENMIKKGNITALRFIF